MMRWKPVLLLFAIFGFLAVAFALFFGALSIFDSPLYAFRLLAYGNSDTDEFKIFAERRIEKASLPSFIERTTLDIPAQVSLPYSGEQRTENIEEFLKKADTRAFLVIKDDRIAVEKYWNSSRDSINTSFSVVKSFDSAMIGAAISDGLIGSVDDPVIEYIPEIAGRGLDQLTIRNLIRMDTGIEYKHNFEIPFFRIPFGDDARTYYGGNLHRVAFSVRPSASPIGPAFRYNNYHPLLEGIIIERVTRMPVAKYLEQKIWKPMGAEYDASWSLDQSDGFEKMESGLNARAIDYARFGLLYLHQGKWNGKNILPAEWVRISTTPDSPERPFDTFQGWQKLGGYYAYHFWGLHAPNNQNDFMAMGNYGQIIYVAPRKNIVIVRLGSRDSQTIPFGVLFRELVNQIR